MKKSCQHFYVWKTNVTYHTQKIWSLERSAWAMAHSGNCQLAIRVRMWSHPTFFLSEYVHLSNQPIKHDVRHLTDYLRNWFKVRWVFPNGDVWLTRSALIWLSPATIELTRHPIFLRHVSFTTNEVRTVVFDELQTGMKLWFQHAELLLGMVWVSKDVPPCNLLSQVAVDYPLDPLLRLETAWSISQ